MTDMAESNLSVPASPVAAKPRSALQSLAKYTFVRIITLFVTVVAAVYLTIIIANLGGFVDEIIKSNIDLAIIGRQMGGWLRDVPPEEKLEIIERTTLEMQEAAGLNQPFMLRTLRWLSDGLTLNWGDPRRSGGFTGIRQAQHVRELILDPLSRTLFIFGTANLLLFFATVFLALTLTRNYGGRLDRLFVLLSPLSSAPAWVYGVILNVVLLRLFSFSTGGTFDAWPSEFSVSYLPIVLRHLIPPVLAIFLAGLFQGVFAWRTFFLLYSSEEYVDMAKAKGLSAKMIDRRYILRPALPGLVTSFALLAMSLWQEVIALEFFFNVEGIGRLFLSALRSLDSPLIVAVVVTFAYLMAITVFILDFVYALVDPRVRFGRTGRNVGRVASKRRGFRLLGRRSSEGRKRSMSNRHASLPASSGSTSASLPTASTSGAIGLLWKGLKRLWGLFKRMARYPTAVLGLSIILALIGVSIYTVLALPYDEAVSIWRGDFSLENRIPRNALPIWVNQLRKEDLPPTIIIDSRQHDGAKSVTAISDEITEITISLPIDYPYSGGFPEDVILYFDPVYEEKEPHVTLSWVTPTGREIELRSFSVRATEVYHFSQDDRLERKLGGRPPIEALFGDPAAESPVPLVGVHVLRVNALVFEEESDLETELVVSGQVYGLAGTDSDRRDLMVALLWGTPVALAFGLVAAVLTSVSGMFFAAIGTWFGGWADRLVQFLTEVNLILPFFPVSLMVFTLYSKSIWVILGVTVALSIFGSAIKTYRATFLQVKESPYIEAARAYGASDWRIVVRYLIPRIMAVLVPRLVILVPSYVFLEATLAFLGVSDPLLPTWGKLVVAALDYGVHRNQFHLVLFPLGLLISTGFAFAMVGLALERIFEPRLRET